MEPKIINVFTDSELQLIKEAIEFKMSETFQTTNKKFKYTTIIKIISRILDRKEPKT